MHDLKKKKFYALSEDKGIGHRSIHLLWCLIFIWQPGIAQERIAPRLWAEQLQASTLLVVYPTYTVKHKRIRTLQENMDASTKAYKRVTRQIQVDEANRDSLLHALALGFKEHFTLLPYYFVADTSFQNWKKGVHKLQVIDTLLQTKSPVSFLPEKVLFLVQGSADSATGTGISIWQVVAGNKVMIPEKFPSSFTDGGHAGTRIMYFFEGLFRWKLRPDKISELSPGTHYLAKRVQSKWEKYLEKMGF